MAKDALQEVQDKIAESMKSNDLESASKEVAEFHRLLRKGFQDQQKKM